MKTRLLINAVMENKVTLDCLLSSEAETLESEGNLTQEVRG